jgi:hypothetical protein
MTTQTTRTTVTLDEVRAAYKALWPKFKRRPGVHAVRSEIGHGSLARITKLLHQVEDEQYGLTPAKDGQALPDRIGAAVASVWAELEKAIAERENELEAEHAQHLAAADARVETAEAARSEAEAKAQALDAEMQTLRGRIDALQKQVVDMGGELETSNTSLRGKEELIAELRNAKQDSITRLVQAEQAAAKREHDLNTKIEQLQLERLNQEQRHQKERDESAKSLADMRDIVAFQRSEAERQRTEAVKVLSDKDALLASVREELEARAEALAKTEQEVEELRRNLRDLDRLVAEQQQAIDAAMVRTETDSDRIRELEQQLAEASGKVDRKR